MSKETEKLERQLLKATGAERDRIAKRLAELAARKNADIRPRGRDAETR